VSCPAYEAQVFTKKKVNKLGGCGTSNCPFNTAASYPRQLTFMKKRRSRETKSGLPTALNIISFRDSHAIRITMKIYLILKLFFHFICFFQITINKFYYDCEGCVVVVVSRLTPPWFELPIQISRLPGKGGYSTRPPGTTSSLVIWVGS